MKAAIRRRMRELCLALDQGQRMAYAQAALARLECLPEFRAAQRILLYHELPDELPIAWFAARCASGGKEVYLPRVEGDDLQILRYDPEALTPGAFGILEPSGQPIDPPIIDLAVVPGRAFDAQGNRLGRGRGYYDRLLPQMPRCVTVGIGYPFQLIDCVPTNGDDVALQRVLC